MKKTFLGLCTAVAIAFAATPLTVKAQVVSQGQILEEGPEELRKRRFFTSNVNYDGEMRKFIRNIAKYGRRFKRDFIVLVKDGDGLLTQLIDIDQLISAPSSVFIQTIDGLIQSAPSYGRDGFGVKVTDKEQKDILEGLKVAQDAGLKIFTLDYANKPKDVDKAIRFARKHKFVPYVAPGMGFRNNALPRWPRRPINENSHTITNAQMIKNYAFVQDSSRFGTPEEYAMKMHNTNYDMVVTSVFHHRSQTLGRHNVRTMQFKKLGSRRPVLAHINIGVADAGAYYWRDDWREGNPSWILGLAPSSSDHHLVKYWHPGWQQVIYGNEKSFLYGIMKEGYDGVVLDGVNIHQMFNNPE